MPSAPPIAADPGRASFAGGAVDLFALKDGTGEATRGDVPATIPLAPIGDIEARDGRFFRLPEGEVENVIARTMADTPEGFVLDWYHDAQSQSAFRTQAAAGWIDPATMRVEGGFLVADVDWTERGAESVAAREVRYISPAFIPDDETRIVLQFTSAALTNMPALQMPALNQNQSILMSESQKNPTGMRAILGLSKDATVEECDALLVSNRKDAEAYAAKVSELSGVSAELAATVELLSAHKDQLAAAQGVIEEMTAADQARAAEAFSAERSAVIGQALADGKITPAQVESFTSIASDSGGLAQVVSLFKVSANLGLTEVTPGLTETPAGPTSQNDPKVYAETYNVSIEHATKIIAERDQG